MKTINLPADTEHLYLDEIAHLIADAIWPNSDINFKSALETLKPELEQAANDGLLRVRHPQTLGLLPPVVLPDDYLDRALHVSNSFPIQYAVVLVPDFAAFVANRGITVVVEAPEQTPQPQPAPAQSTATPAPVVQATETREQRQDRRLKACIDAGLPMDTRAALSRLPDGVGNVADRENVTRQAFSTDVKAALTRRKSAIREGVQVHRA